MYPKNLIKLAKKIILTENLSFIEEIHLILKSEKLI